MIVPALNEALGLPDSMRELMRLRDAGAQIVVVDGGSEDATVSIARSAGADVIQAQRGRARQMNAGAQYARGKLLLFLHADTRLTEPATRMLATLVTAVEVGESCWGRFDLQLASPQWPFRIIERMINFRSRLSGIATGDQAIFVSQELFAQAGGFPDIPLMEDIGISKELRRRVPPICLRQRVVTDARRWEKKGIVRTILLMWWLRAAFFFGVCPKKLAAWYQHVR